MTPLAAKTRQPAGTAATDAPPWGHSGNFSSSLSPLPGANSALVDLTRRVKEELARRYEQGERPTASEYLARHPEIAADRDRAVSLIYEEYCLREEYDQAPTPEEFCRRYDPWRDSLASQLRYHRLLSSVLEPKPPSRFPVPGDTFAGRFILRDLLGEGGSARVFLAEQPDVGNRRVALKISAATGREPSILGRLDHDHIVPVWSIEDDPETGLRALCMPYRAGLPLDRVLKRIDPLAPAASALAFWKAIQQPADATEATPTQRAGWRGFPTRGSHADAAAWITLVVARALAHAHGRGVLHRDIKPANILLTLAGPQLLDFNLADAEEEDPAQARKALQGGTLPYMAPEQLHAFLDPTRWKDVGPAADQYSLGLVLRELLTGQRPPSPPGGISTPRIINELLDLRARQHRWTRLDNPAVPHALAAIVARCTAHAIADRYPDVHALADDLERYLSRRPLRYAFNPSRAERAANWFWRHRTRLIAATVLLTLGAAGTVAARAIAAANRSEASVEAERKLAERWLDENEKDARGVLNDPARKARLQEIRTLYERDAAADPNNFTAFLNLAHIDETYPDPSWSARERLERPLARFNRAIEIISRRNDVLPKHRAEALLNRALIHLLLGILAEQEGRMTDSIEHLRASLSDAEPARRDLSFLDSLRRIRLFYVAARARAHLARGLMLDQHFAEANPILSQAIQDLDQLDRLLQALSEGPVDSCFLDPALVKKFQAQSHDLRSRVESVVDLLEQHNRSETGTYQQF